MNHFIADTNTLVSFVTDRNPAQQSRIAPWFERAAALECRIVIPAGVVIEFVYVLDRVYQVPPVRIREMLTALMGTPGLEIHEALGLERVMTLWPQPVREFGDAQVVAAAQRVEGAAVLTFDTALRRMVKKLGIPAAP